MRWRKGPSPLLILALFIMQWDSGGGRGTCPGLVSTELLHHCGSRAFSGNEAQPRRLQQILSGTCKEDKGGVAWESRREVKHCDAAKERLFWVMHAFKSQIFKGIKSWLFSKLNGECFEICGNNSVCIQLDFLKSVYQLCVLFSFL